MFTLTQPKIKACLFAFILTLNACACHAADNKLVCGAYIAQTGAAIAEYETLCGAENSIYLLSTDKGYPRDGVIECYANGKIPMLLIGKGTRLSLIPQLAADAGEYGLPMYICIGGDVERYRYCVGIFRTKCKNAKFVQPVMLSDTDYEFAGCDYTDCLAVTATFSDKNPDTGALYNAIEQADVPVMINLAACRYSEDGHRYTTLDAIKTLNYVYAIKNAYPDKLFGINYINIAADGRKYDVCGEKKLRIVYGGEVCKWGKKLDYDEF